MARNPWMIEGARWRPNPEDGIVCGECGSTNVRSEISDTVPGAEGLVHSRSRCNDCHNEHDFTSPRRSRSCREKA